MIEGAVGFAFERGDAIEVVNKPVEAKLPITAFEVAEENMLERFLPSIIRYGTIMLIALLVLFFVIRPMISGIFKAGPTMISPGPGVPLPAEGIPMTAEEMAPPEPVIPASPVAEKKKDVREVVKGSPEQSAQIIKRWVRGRTDEG